MSTMSRANLISKINEIAATTFTSDQFPLDEKTRLADIKGWNSIRQVDFIVKVEQNFSVKFSGKDIVSAKKLEDILNLVERYLSK